MNKKKQIWIEKLTLFKCLWILTKRKRKEQIFYTSATSLASLIAKFISNIKFVQTQKGILDKNGKAIIYEVETKSYEYVLKMHKLLFLHDIIPISMKHFQDEWQRILKSYLESLIKKKLIIISFIKQQYENNFFDKFENIDFIGEDFPFDNIFYDLLNKDDDDINYVIWPNLFRLFYRINILSKIFISIIYSFFYRFFRNDYINNKKKPHIFEEHIFNIFDRYPDAGHLFWFESSKINPDDLVLYFDRSDLKINKNLIKKINDHNMHSLNMLHPVINIDRPLKVMAETIKEIKFFKSFNYNEIDIWLTKIKFIYLINCFRKVINKYDCKIIHQHQEFWPNTLCMALAIRMENGVFIWNHWSVDHFPITYFNWGFADIIFSWGDYNDGYFNCHDFSYKYLFQTGLIASDGNYKISEYDKKNYRGKLSNNLDLIINILDSTFGPNHQNSKTSMIFFYRELLRKIYENKGWGGIIKSKGKSFESIMNEKEINNFIKLLKKENRLIILPPDLKVSVSANISDISVCYGINSAGIIAALSGSKSIYWDLPGAKEHPLYYLKKKDKLIFNSINEIHQALEKFALGNKEIGNHDDCLDLFDSFRDDEGRKRAGEVIFELFNDMKNNLEIDESLDKIMKKYELKWGKRFVCKFKSGNNHKGNQLWNQVIDNIKKSKSNNKYQIKCVE